MSTMQSSIEEKMTGKRTYSQAVLLVLPDFTQKQHVSRLIFYQLS